MNYTELDNKLQGRNKESRKLANNTYAIRDGENIAIRLHSTNVVTITPDNDKILNSGGWHTLTTKDRINQAIGNKLYQQAGVWYVNGTRFEDGMTIKADGSITGGGIDNPKADRQFKAKVKAYAKLYTDALPLEHPGAGDCWYCSMLTQDKQTLGDAFKDTDHISLHIEEGYVVPSLAYNALKEAGNTDFILSLVFNGGGMQDVARERVYKAVYRYILKRKGYLV